MADAGTLSHRRLQPAQRPAHAAQQAADRRLRRVGLLHPGLNGGQRTVASVSTTTPCTDWESAPAPESREVVTIQREYGLFVDGQFVPPASGEHFTTLNPASEEPLATIAQAGEADVDQAVEGIVNGIFFNQGHVCCAGSRLLLQESVADAVLDRLKRRLATLRLGDPLDKNTDIGAINSRQQLDKIEGLVAAGEAEGAQRWSPPCQLPARGYWFPPTVFSGVSQSHKIAREEIFGPVLSVLTFRTPEEAVAKANNTPYGLSAGIWTEKGSRILWMAGKLRAGVVWANTYNRFDPASPFGGYRESGFGREGGRAGLAAYLDA